MIRAPATRRVPFVLAFAILFLTPLTALSASVDAPADTTIVASNDRDLSSPKSPGRATALSLLGTAVPIGLGFIVGESNEDAGGVIGLTGFVVGPSLGHFYSGGTVRGIAGMVIRSASVVGMAYAFADIFEEDDGSSVLGTVSLVAGAASMTIDIITAAGSANAYNKKYREGLILAPALELRAGGNLRVGLAATF